MKNEHTSVKAIRDHYDRISFFYRALWGEHIHHGYWKNGESPAEAQINLIEELAKRARIDVRGRVLDIGCGIGGSSRWLARHLDCDVLGITISPVQARMARERARAEKLEDRLSFMVMDANDLSLPAEGFDAVWIIECSEHIMHKERFMKNCARALKPGGVIALCAWLASNKTDEHERLVQEVCDGMLCPSLATLNDYVRWMRVSGFGEIEAEEITRHVEKTWAHCIRLARRPEIKALLHLTNQSTRRFVKSFAAIQRAYSVGAMSYGMFTARKSSRPEMCDSGGDL